MENGSVRETIKKLLILQERDCRIARCLNESRDIPLRKKAIESATQQHCEALEKAKDMLKTRQVSIHKLDIEIETERQHVLKLRDQQFLIKSNEEYKTLNHEIGQIEETIRGLEDREIELMEEVEQAECDVARIESELAREQTSVKQELEQLEKRRGTLESEIGETKKDRDMVSSGIDKSWLRRYNQIIANKKDIALAVVEESGSCGACHMNLPPQVVHDVRRASSMVSCSFCGRLLYWAE